MRKGLIAFALILVAADGKQDFEAAKKDFKQAVISMSASGVKSAAGALVKADNKQAVDVLLDGYGVCAQQIKSLWGEKLKYKQEMEQNSDFRINYSTNPPTVEAGDVSKYQKYQKAQSEAQAVEKKIMSIEEVKREVVRALRGFGSDEAVKELISKLKNDADWTRRAGVAEALGEISNADSAPALLAQLKTEREAGVKVAILDALRAKGVEGEENIALIAERVKDEFWQVQVAALQCLKTIGSAKARSAIPAVIDALQKADGRMKHEINDVLVALTGVDKHGDHAAWKAWWDQNQSSVAGGTYQPPKDGQGVQQGAKTTFYGIPVESKRVIFVLDRSGSMAEPSEWNIPEDTATGGTSGGEGDIKKTGDRKIDIARWQLKRCLGMMADGTEFNLIFFNHEVGDATILNPKGLIKLTKGTRKQAFDFIDGLDPQGGTNIYDPMERGLQMCGAGGAPGTKPAKSSADTIFLLTDGMPNSGQVPGATDIVTKIRDLNKLTKVKINAVGVFTTKGAGSVQPGEKEEGTKFLKQLAEDAGGIFTSADSDGGKKKGRP